MRGETRPAKERRARIGRAFLNNQLNLLGGEGGRPG